LRTDNHPRVSVVIPTRNRPELLANLLFSIIKQTIPPDEVIIVDDSDDFKTAELANVLRDAFSNKGVELKYLQGRKGTASISNARNIGITTSKGDIIFFIDDDIILKKNYIEEILKVYNMKPTAKGVQGFIINSFRPFGLRHILINSLRKVFFLNHFEKNKCTLRHGQCYPYAPEGIIECEWLHSSNMSLKKEIFTYLKFDNNFTFKGRSVAEDARLTSKVYKLYPHSLFMNPNAKVYHSPPVKKISKRHILTSVLFLIHTAFCNPSFKGIIRGFWTFLGHFLTYGAYLLSLRDPNIFFYLIKCYFIVINHLKNIKRGDFKLFEDVA